MTNKGQIWAALAAWVLQSESHPYIAHYSYAFFFTCS